MPKFEQRERPFIQCGYMACIKRAILRKDGIPLCQECYDLRHLNEAQKWNHENGLDTEEKRKEYVFKNSGVFKPMP